MKEGSYEDDNASCPWTWLLKGKSRIGKKDEREMKKNQLLLLLQPLFGPLAP